MVESTFFKDYVTTIYLHTHTKMKRIPIMCEINEDYAKVINEREGLIYDIRK